MAEYIKREDVMEEFCDECIERDFCDRDADICHNLAIIAKFSAADVRENVRGEWLLTLSDVFDFYKCSVCGHRIEAPGGVPHENFCPNCGASMQTKQKGSD